VIVDAARYHQGVRVPLDCETTDFAALRARLTGDGDFVWIGMFEPESSELSGVAKAFSLHPLAVEDAVSAHQRPKLEHYADSLFFTIKTVWYVEEHDAIETGEINMFLGPDFVITVRHGEGAKLKDSRAYLERHANVLAHGPAAVVYAVCDFVVDQYEAVISAVEEDVDEVEQSVFSTDRTRDSARIYTLKRELAEMRRAVSPLKEPLRRLSLGLVPGVAEETAPFFRDVADHVVRVAEMLDALDGLLSTAFEAHLASISVQQNEDMRKISAGAALVVVPTLIAGVYGMNFEHMPELAWTYGYAYALILMGVVAGALFWLFKRSGWL